ncbi:glucose N-acetyltransferase [Colletotrichum falcatum]|nr:glucose N-acetyltransferase [Colletotrichum falcatum]
MLPPFFRFGRSYTKVSAGVETSPGLTPSNDRPRLGELFAFRRFRWLAGALVGVVFLTAFYAKSDRIPAIRTSSASSSQQQTKDNVDWSRFAYVQYATNTPYLCNSVMFFERLEHLQSKPDRVLLYPSYMLDPQAKVGDSEEARLLIRARDVYRVKLVPITVQHRDGDDPTWAESFTKLLSFNQTQYQRTMSIDSDSTLQKHMDELFLLPPCPLVATRAYWLPPNERPKLNSQLMVIEPSEAEFARVAAKIESAGPGDFDMEIVDNMYKESAMILPHRPYLLLTGTLRGEHADWWLGNSEEAWDPVAAYNNASLVHFSDWPRPKPWLPAAADAVEKMRPKCVMKDGAKDCSAAVIWDGIYADFAARRKVSRGCSTNKHIKTSLINIP